MEGVLVEVACLKFRAAETVWDALWVNEFVEVGKIRWKEYRFVIGGEKWEEYMFEAYRMLDLSIKFRRIGDHANDGYSLIPLLYHCPQNFIEHFFRRALECKCNLMPLNNTRSVVLKLAACDDELILAVKDKFPEILTLSDELWNLTFSNYTLKMVNGLKLLFGAENVLEGLKTLMVTGNNAGEVFDFMVEAKKILEE